MSKNKINKNTRSRRRIRSKRNVVIVNKVPPRPPPPPPRRKPPPPMPRRIPRTSSEITQYKMSLLNPFDARCAGVRTPDAGAFSTVPFRYRSELTMVTGLASGNSAFAFLPSIFCTSYFDGLLPVTWPSTTAFTANATYNYYTSPNSFNYATYRVVSGGITVSCMLPELYATGRLIISPWPLTGNPLGWNTMQFQSPTSQTVPLLVFSGGGAPSPGMLSFPSAYKVSLIDLLRKPLLIPFQIESPTLAYKFKSCFGSGADDWSTSTSLVEPGETFTVSGGAIIGNTSSTSDTTLDFSGWNAIYLYVEGVPLSGTYSGAALNIEHILHCEGVPNVASSSAAYSIADMRPLVGSTSILESAIDTANKILDNTTKRVFDIGMDSLMGALTGVRLGSRASGKPGIMSLMNGE